jgi:hypothetical protein
MPHSVTDGREIRRSALPCNAGALRRSLLRDGDPSRFGPEAPGSIHRRRRSGFHQPPDLFADARRVLVPFIARSSRCPRSLEFALWGVKVARSTRFVASAREHRQSRVARKAWIRLRQLAQEKPRAAGRRDQPNVAAGMAEARWQRAGSHPVTVPGRAPRPFFSASTRLGVGGSAPSEPEPAEPAANHRQPEQAAGGLGEDGEKQEQAGNSQDHCRDRPLDQAVQAHDVDIDKAVDRAEGTLADRESIVTIGRDSAPGSWRGGWSACGCHDAGICAR